MQELSNLEGLALQDTLDMVREGKWSGETARQNIQQMIAKRGEIMAQVHEIVDIIGEARE